MAKTKAELLEEAKALSLEVTTKNTVAEISEAIKEAKADKKKADQEVIANREATVAKAGKRSQKAIDEAEEKAEKQARKESGEVSQSAETTKKGPAPKVRSRLERRGKNYRKVAEKIETGKVYPLNEAVKLAAETNPSKFDASVEVHVRLGVDPRQSDQNIRATVALPHGTGKVVRVAVFAPEDQHAAATKAGADIVGDESLLALLAKDEINFDVLIATPQYMPRLGKYARALGPKGLMPNPKSGTVSANVDKAVTEAKAGRVEYRVDKQAIIHLSIGKVSFGADKLVDNAKAFFSSLNTQRPTSLKGNYVRSISISTTMGPGIKVENSLN